MADRPSDERRGMGASVPRKADDRHLRGREQLVADIPLRGAREVGFCGAHLPTPGYARSPPRRQRAAGCSPPPIRIAHLHTQATATEHGMKGMGEGGGVAPRAAIADAVRDALAPMGAEVNKPPLTPRRVLAAIKRAHGPELGSLAMNRPLLVIDGDSFAHRAFHALPKSIRRAGNRGGGAIVGFANFMLRLFESEQPRAVLVGWDSLGAPTYRQQLFPDYQGGRHFADELVDQLEVLPDFVAACGFANAKASGYEADDFLAAAAAAEECRRGTVLVASGDRDAFQLASAATTILHPLKAGVMARIGPAEVRERYGVEPHQVPDFIALRGDPSDKLPGARGVGPKGAAALLHRHGTLEHALAEGQLSTQADALMLYRRIATMDTTAPLPALDDQIPTWDRAAALAGKWDLTRLARRLEELAEAAAGS